MECRRAMRNSVGSFRYMLRCSWFFGKFFFAPSLLFLSTFCNKTKENSASAVTPQPSIYWKPSIFEMHWYFHNPYRLHMSNNPQSPLERVGRLLVLVACWGMTVMVCLSRIYLQYHTWNQVMVGSIVGAITGILWFTLTHLVFSPLFPTIASWYVHRRFDRKIPIWNLTLKWPVNEMIIF